MRGQGLGVQGSRRAAASLRPGWREAAAPQWRGVTQETLPQPFLQHFWLPEQLESVLHWFMQTPSMGIPGLTGGQVPGFSAKAKGHGLRPAGPSTRGKAGPAASGAAGMALAPGCRRGGTPVPAGSFPTPCFCPLVLLPACPDGDTLGRPCGVVIPHGPCAQPPAQGCVAGTGRAAAARSPRGSLGPAFPYSCRGQLQPCARGARAQLRPQRGARAPPDSLCPGCVGPLPCRPAACHCLPPALGSWLCTTPSSAVAQPGQLCPCRRRWRYQSLWFTSVCWQLEIPHPVPVYRGGSPAGPVRRAYSARWLWGHVRRRAGDGAVGRLFPGAGSGGRTVPTSRAGGCPRRG